MDGRARAADHGGASVPLLQGEPRQAGPTVAGSTSTPLLSQGEPRRDGGALLLLMGSVSFASNALVGLVVPFLPHALKALRPTPQRLDVLNGCLMAVFPLTMVVASPVVGRLLGRLGRFSVLRLGLVTQCVATGLFAFAPTIGGGTLAASVPVFIAARVGQGSGACMSNMSIFAIILDAYAHNLAATLGLNEVAIGLGFATAPLLGSGLYALGGFRCPFFAACGVFALMVPLASWCERQDLRDLAVGMSSPLPES
jgi:MFS family permease